MYRTFIIALATWFGSGLAKKAPGTFGTLAALPFAWVMQRYLGMEFLIAATVCACVGGVWVCNEYLRVTGKGRDADPKEVVIDEVAGMWLVLCLMPLNYMEVAFEWMPVSYVGGFLFFRLFDIWKPWPVSLADRKIKGGLGIMVDDFLASVYAVMALGVVGHLARPYLTELLAGV